MSSVATVEDFVEAVDFYISARALKNIKQFMGVADPVCIIYELDANSNTWVIVS
jgi:hypothetical protein